MANAFVPLRPMPFGVSGWAVKVTSVDPAGYVHLARASDRQSISSTPVPPYVKLPIPSNEALQLVSRTLLKKEFVLYLVGGGIVEYNIFMYDARHDFTLHLYMNIVGMLKDPIGLPEEGDRRVCRVSPLCDATQLYIQPQPAYVDTVSYAIFLAISDKKIKKMINPAEDLFIGKIYIYADGVQNYRVKLVRGMEMQKSIRYTNSINSRVSTETETTVSTSCSPVRECENERVGVPSVSGSGDGYHNIDHGKLKDGNEESGEETAKESEGDSDHLDRILSEQVTAFCIDYGCHIIDVPKFHLYTVESVCPALKPIPPLAFPVNVQYINRSLKYRDARMEDLRSRKKNIEIMTTARGTSEIPATVDIFC